MISKRSFPGPPILITVVIEKCSLRIGNGSGRNRSVLLEIRVGIIESGSGSLVHT